MEAGSLNKYPQLETSRKFARSFSPKQRKQKVSLAFKYHHLLWKRNASLILGTTISQHQEHENRTWLALKLPLQL